MSQGEAFGAVFELTDRVVCAFRGTKPNLDNLISDVKCCWKGFLPDSEADPKAHINDASMKHIDDSGVKAHQVWC